MVRNMAIAGVPIDTIRKVLEIGSKTTLYKHYRGDIEHGKSEMLGKVAGRLFENAMHEDGRISNPAAMFIMKTQAGWREKSDVNLTSDDGTMTPPRIIKVVGVDAKQ
jgi:hypothetical protein